MSYIRHICLQLDHIHHKMPYTSCLTITSYKSYYLAIHLVRFLTNPGVGGVLTRKFRYCSLCFLRMLIFRLKNFG